MFRNPSDLFRDKGKRNSNVPDVRNETKTSFPGTKDWPRRLGRSEARFRRPLELPLRAPRSEPLSVAFFPAGARQLLHRRHRSGADAGVEVGGSSGRCSGERTRVGAEACGAGSEATGVTAGRNPEWGCRSRFQLSGAGGRWPGSGSGRARCAPRKWWRTGLRLAPGSKAWGEAEERDAGGERGVWNPKERGERSGF